MHIRRLILLTAVAAGVLAACGAPAAGTAPITPTVGAAPTAVIAQTAMTVPTAVSAPATGIVSAAPNDATQARLRVSNCIFNGPTVDVVVNGAVAVNGGRAQAHLRALFPSGYLYLTPGTYSVALVPTGKGLAQALLGPLDVPVVAGHRYTVAMLGQVGDAHYTPLVIDETAAYQAVGATPTSFGHISINNIKGLPGMDIANGGVLVEQNVPYGGFKAGLWTVGYFKDLDMTVSGAANKNIGGFKGDGFNPPGVDTLDCFSGSYPGANDTETSANTSALTTIEFLQGWSGKGVKHSNSLTFDTFLAAIKTAGLTDLLANNSPYALFVPTDDAFATMPKAERDALLANPKALADLVRGHISPGYYPAQSFSKTPGEPWDRTITNMLGAKLVLGDSTINGAAMGDLDSFFVANGIRVSPIPVVVLPAAK
jgi:Fasciclin domain/Domain of unknown function (DUF4397)